VTFFQQNPFGERPATPTLPTGRSRTFLIAIAIVVALGLLTSFFAGFYTDYLWFKSVGSQTVFTTILISRILLFSVTLVLSLVFLWGTVFIAYKLRPAQVALTVPEAVDRLRKLLAYGIAGVLAVLMALSGGANWSQWLSFLNREPFNYKDPHFGIDVSFFVFTYPIIRLIVGTGITLALFMFIIGFLIHSANGAIVLQPDQRRVTPQATAHLSAILAVFMLFKAGAYWLDRYGLAVQSNTLVDGLQYTDVQAVLPTRTLLAAIAALISILFVVNIFRRSWRIPITAVGLLVATSVVAGGIFPSLLEQFRVRPSQAALEAPYIQRGIDVTRDAYSLTNVEKEDYAAVSQPRIDNLDQFQGTLNKVRLMDPAQLAPTFNQLQQIKGYYSFGDKLDVARYEIDGEVRGAILATREINLNAIPQALNFINSTFVYTHGFGISAAFDNTVRADGGPVFFERDIPPKGPLTITEPRIYFGERSPAYSIVGAPEGAEPRELDYPDETSPTGQQNNTYRGSGGVPIGSFFNRLMYALSFSEINIMLSDYVNEESQVLYIRDPRARVQNVAPWLTLDSDPYPIVSEGRIKWIVDAYTTTSLFPYSERVSLGIATTDALAVTGSAISRLSTDQVNYMRNSVKAVVDSYEGTVTLYAWEADEPILKVWNNVFPGLIKSREDMPESVFSQVRYPQDLFKVQRAIYAKYHVTTPASFYNGQDFWAVPQDPTAEGRSVSQPPYYLQIQLPGDTEESFMLTSAFSPVQRQTLAAFIAVGSDPTRDDYGRLRVLQLPSNTVIPGPNQVQNNFESDPQVGRELSLLRQGGSDVRLGNLLSLPIAGGFLYIEPVYVQGSAGDGYPLLRRVLASFGQKVVFTPSLEEALFQLFGSSAGNAGVSEPEPNEPDSPPVTNGQSAEQRLKQALADMQAAVSEAETALRNGDFAAYGVAQRKLEAALKRALEAQEEAGSTSG
jgi:uncharacterized membrane protein (UPF0182 family)